MYMGLPSGSVAHSRCSIQLSVYVQWERGCAFCSTAASIMHTRDKIVHGAKSYSPGICACRLSAGAGGVGVDAHLDCRTVCLGKELVT